MERQADHPIDQLFLRRWSPRAMSGVPVAEYDLMRLFEAARWAPSSANAQPWRFVYAIAGTEDFRRFHDLLNEGNQSWCHRAGALVVVLSKTTFDNGKPNRVHSFDAGSAWMSIALQGTHMGLVVHGMAGFDYEGARIAVAAPSDLAVEAMIAIGHPGKVEDLPEKYRPREVRSSRHPVSQFVQKGTFHT